MSRDKIVAFAALTQADLNTFAKDLKEVFPVDDEPCFAALLNAIDEADQQRRRESKRRAALAKLKSH